VNKDINKLVWLILPISVAIMPYVARFMGAHTDTYMYGEKGIIENLTAIFDQIPRTLLSIAALIGGVLIPLYRRRKQHVLDQNALFDWILPTFVCLPAAFLSLLVSWHEKIYELMGTNIPSVLDIRAGETKECMLALFMMMYALSIWYRNRNVSRGNGG